MKQIKKACKGCPFKKGAHPKGSKPGGSPVQTYIGQARGPFWLPCHNDKSYADKESDPAKVMQCAGAAIFRANCNDRYSATRPEALLQLEPDTETVFGSEKEMFQHYTDMSDSLAEMFTDELYLDYFMVQEFESARQNGRAWIKKSKDL